MTKFSKNLKYATAKIIFLPFLFVALFLLSLFNFAYADSTAKVNNCNEVVLTQPYSEEYLQYLSLSEEEKQSIDVIPRLYDVEFESLYSTASYQSLAQTSLPTEYVLFNLPQMISNFSTVNKTNFETLNKNVGNQYGAGICWTYAANTALETSLYKSGLVESGEVLNFSELNMAYKTHVVNRGLTTIGGGNFGLAYEYLSTDQGPYDEGVNESYNGSNLSHWANDSVATKYYKDNYYLSAVKSGYKVLESVSYPSVEDCSTQTEVLELRNSIKNHIKTYGGVTASVFYNDSYLSNGHIYMYNGGEPYTNHEVTLVGWDDDFTYTLSNQVYTGAYIAQNSYGTNWGSEGYFYVLYDDKFIETDVNGFVRFLKVEENEEEDSLTYNNYQTNIPFIDFDGSSILYRARGVSDNYTIANLYLRQDVDNQYLSEIKVPTTAAFGETSFYVYYLDGINGQDITTEEDLKNYLQNNFSSATRIKNKNATGSDNYLYTSYQTGFYTIDLQEELNISGEYFAIFMQIVSGEMFYANNASNISMHYQLTYRTVLTDGQSGAWIPYYSLKRDETTGLAYEDSSVHCVLPMVVKTEYQFGTIDYTASGYSAEYDAQKHRINVSVNSPDDYKLYYSLTGLDGSWSENNIDFKNVTSTKVYFKIEAEFYETVINYVEVNIHKKNLIFTPYSNQSKTYGESDPILSGKFEGYYETPSYTGRLSRQEGNDVGNYEITLGSFAINTYGSFNADNYNLVFATTKVYFTIMPRDFVVAPVAKTKTYGEADPQLTYIYSNNVSGETPLFTGDLSREVGEDVGSYDIYQNTLEFINSDTFKTSNYNFVFTNNLQTFVIGQKTLIVTPLHGQEKPYLGAEIELLYDVTGTVNGEIAGFTGALSRQTGEDAGEYDITIGNLALKDNTITSGDQTITFKSINYKIEFITGVKFLITLGQLTGFDLPNVEVDYDGQYHYLSPSCSDYEGITYYYSTDNLTWQSERIGYKNVGNYTLYVQCYKANYTSKYLHATININPIEITITPVEGQSKIYGDNEPLLDYNYFGNVLGETPAFTGRLVRAEGEIVGEYLIESGDISIQNSDTFLKDNYYLVFENSSEVCFNITKRDLFVVPYENQSKTYGKVDPQYLFYYENEVAGEKPNFTGVLLRESGENIGSYLFEIGSVDMENSASFNKNNYNLEFTSKLVYFEITKANIIVTVDDVTAYFDNQTYVSEFSYQVSGDYVEGDNLNVVYSCPVKSSTKKGTYEISATASNNNYIIEVVSGIYTVLYKNYTVTFTVLGEVVKTVQVEHFSAVQTNDVPTVNVVGHIFSYWAILHNNAVYEKKEPNETQIVGDTNFVAVLLLDAFKLNYVLNGGEFKGDYLQEFTIETETFNLDEPERVGYNFAGWFETETFESERITKVEKGTSKDLTLYAKWEIKVFTATLPELVTDAYIITCLQDTNINYNASFEFTIELTQIYNQSASTLKVYALWEGIDTPQEILKNEEEKYVIGNIDNNFEIVLEGINKNKYSVFFYADNNLVGSIEKEHGSSLLQSDYPTIPTKENYNNTDPYWDRPVVENIVGNEIVSAVYIPNIYNVIFVMEDGKEIHTTVTYGESVNEQTLKDNYPLTFFEYFVYDTPLDNISNDTIINVKIESNIYILYIAIGCVAGLIVLGVTIGISKKIKRRKFSWWYYADENDADGGS
ncbi:MAG: InlB B-repeat-containing protein, partial [Clostridia bacterium]|nr:InlB B-repeat-containing protein [Clostridia bacterium]